MPPPARANVGHYDDTFERVDGGLVAGVAGARHSVWWETHAYDATSAKGLWRHSVRGRPPQHRCTEGRCGAGRRSLSGAPTIQDGSHGRPVSCVLFRGRMRSSNAAVTRSPQTRNHGSQR